MTIQELFIMSNQALQRSVEQIHGDQWELSMPPGASNKPTTLGEAVRYHIYDDAWVPDVLAGKTKDEVGPIYEGLLQIETAAIQTDFRQYNERAQDAVQQFTELDRMVHLSYGDFSAGDYLQHIISFRAFRSYDIAKLVGADTRMAPEFVQALSQEFSPVIEAYRQMGVFPPAVAVSDAADAQTKLLAMVGRS